MLIPYLQMEYTDVSLKPYNTFGIDVRARRLVVYDDIEELRRVIAAREGLDATPVLHIGSGSNLLFLGDYEGLVLYCNIRNLDVVREDGDSMILNVGAGWIMDDFIAECVRNRWYGLENLSHIPGQVGASAVQNIGAYGVEAADNIVSVHCVDLNDGSARTFLKTECNYGYRHSIFKEDGVRGRYAVVSVDYRLSRKFVPRLEYGGILRALEENHISVSADVPPGWRPLTAQNLRETIIGIRRQKLPDPKILGNAGSFFMNPVIPKAQFDVLRTEFPDMPSYVVDEERVKVPAGWMIEQCGWKGRSLGRAAVHDRQALVLVNKGGATGKDIVALCEAIRASVLSRFGITISPEVNFI